MEKSSDLGARSEAPVIGVVASAQAATMKPGARHRTSTMVSRYGKSLEEVKCKQRSALRELDQGRDVSAGRPMLGDYL